MSKTEEKNNLEKKEITSIKKNRRKKLFLKILAGISLVVFLFVVITTGISLIGLKSNINKAKSLSNVGSRQLKLENPENGYWNIYSDDGLKVLQLTDIHIGGGWMSMRKDSMALNAVAAIITAEKPDFVIVTGDIAYPVPFQAGTFNNKSGARIFAELMESLGVYWTLSFGNHDTEAYSYYSRKDISNFYSSEKYPHCLFQAGPEHVDGYGNQIINIVNSDEIIIRSFIIFDSHSYVDGDIFGIAWKYDNIHDNQIEWYKKSIEKLNNKNKNVISNINNNDGGIYSGFQECIPSSVFLHIPLTEYRDAWNEYANNDYQDTDNVKMIYGAAGESGLIVYCGMNEDYLFETMKEIGSTDSVFCGHDHLNNFSVDYKGIRLTYSMSIDYLAYLGIYKLGAQRGCTVINVDKTGEIDFYAENYYQDKYISKYQKENVTMQQLGNN
jgi:3',5'-cyclic AMP phosphodiesterase CpdA